MLEDAPAFRSVFFSGGAVVSQVPGLPWNWLVFVHLEARQHTYPCIARQ